MSTMQSEVPPYLAAVRAALADLPAEERDELLEDLEGHLAEVAVEADGSLASRLGPPEAYAAELRSSAGLPPAGRQTRGRVSVRRAVQRVRTRALAVPGVRPVLQFLPELRPGWWLLRGWLVVVVLAVLAQNGHGLSRFPLLRVSGSLLLGLALVVAAVVLSVRLGRVATGRWGPLVVAANGILVVTAVVTAVHVQRDHAGISYVVVAHRDPFSNVLRGPNGPINNFFVFDSAGRPLSDVQIFDQNGNAVNDLLLQTSDGRYTRPSYLTGPDGTTYRNVFPRRYTVEAVGPNGLPSPAPLPAPAVAARPLPSPAPSPSPTAAPSPAPAG
jgi:hypothetical protein